MLSLSPGLESPTAVAPQLFIGRAHIIRHRFQIEIWDNRGSILVAAQDVRKPGWSPMDVLGMSVERVCLLLSAVA